MEKAAQMQMHIRENSTELTDFLQDLTRWEDKIKKEDENLKTSRRIDEKLPPIRKGKKPTKDKKEQANNDSSGQSNAVPSSSLPLTKEKIKSYDYDAWSKFDVEAACQEVDNTEDEDSSDEYEDCDEEEVERIEEERKLQQAAMEKDKGNQLFKEGKYDAAINRYTIAIGLSSTNPILYANRGMALLKKERYGAAEQDCTIALQLDPTYTKAYARRGTTRQKLKKYQDALDDFNSVLEHEPNNKQALLEIQSIKKALKTIKDEQKKSNKKKSDVEDTVLVNTNDNAAKRKKRSNKPLKRIFIQEVGADDDDHDDDYKGNNDKPKETTNSSTSPQKNDRVPPLHQQSNEVAKDTPLFVMDTPLVVPTTSFMFESELKRLKNDQEKLYAYLKMIPCKSYAKLFHQCIDNLISCFLKTLSTCYVRDKLEVWEELEQFSLVERFSMAAMFLSRTDKKVLDELFSYIKSTDYPANPPISDEKLRELSKAYGVKLS